MVSAALLFIRLILQSLSFHELETCSKCNVHYAMSSAMIRPYSCKYIAWIMSNGASPEGTPLHLHNEVFLFEVTGLDIRALFIVETLPNGRHYLSVEN